MAENRQYAGPHIAADILVADGLYATVVHRELTDEQAYSQGYTFDDEDGSGRIFAHRTITISDELAAHLTDTDEWPRVGGVADDDKAVDDPTSNPVTAQTYELADGTEISGPELNERARTEGAAEAAADHIFEEAASAANDTKAQRQAIERRVAELDARAESLTTALEAENIDDDDRASINAELAELAVEREGAVKALGGSV